MTYSGADLLVPAGIKCDGTSRHKQEHIYIGRVMKFGLFLGIFMSLKTIQCRYDCIFGILSYIYGFYGGMFGILWGFVTYLWVLWRYV